jgi:hypothetical protein
MKSSKTEIRSISSQLPQGHAVLRDAHQTDIVFAETNDGKKCVSG